MFLTAFRVALVLTTAAVLVVGCGRRGSPGTSKKEKDPAKTGESTTTAKGGGSGDGGAVTTDGGGTPSDARGKTADPGPAVTAALEKPLTDGEVGFVLARWETIRNTIGKDKPAFKASDLPLDAWAGSLPKVPDQLEKLLGTVETREFLRVYPRMAKLYRCSVGLPPENDSTRDARLTAEAQANSPDSTAEEKTEARKRLETLRKRAWDDARAGFDGNVKPTDAEFAIMQRRERQLHAMFKGVQDVDD